MKFVHPNDQERGEIQNNFTLQGSGGALVLNDRDKLYLITEVRASGAWSCNYTNSKGESYTRNGSGNTLLHPPWSAEILVFSGILEVSGYFMEVGNV
ncbi:MAG: hypothetical protein HS129_04945 [Leptospiraceae bacterium]|nr:hypothetical protein [Leptospiraceae bacterium]